MEIELKGEELPERGVAVLPIGTDGTLGAAGQTLDARSGGALRGLVADLVGELKHGKLVELRRPAGLGLARLLLLPLGKPEGLKPLDLETAGGNVAKALQAAAVTAAALAPTSGLAIGHEEPEASALIALGAALRSYRFTRYRTQRDEDDPGELASLTLHLGTDGPAATRLERVRHELAAVGRTRDLVSEPANVLGPVEFAERCRELEQHGVTVEILDEKALAEHKMNAFLGVAQGSARPPRMVVMRWAGGGTAPPVALIGKGVCFDTGGISIKPAAGMEEMKWDMAGAAVVVGAMELLARRKATAEVVGVIGLAENMPSGTAQRPGDVVTAMSGTTIEVINTDAEGRLILADVLWYTKERFKPRAMVDLATLTGAIVVALGHEQAGLFTSDEALAKAIQDAAGAVGEEVWRMPLRPGYHKHIRSAIADIKNVGRAREAGATAGAVFLERFVGDVPWAHLDIAGVAWTSRDLPLAAKGATGFGVRLLDRMVDRLDPAER